jgi:hypothetical protein
VLVALGLPTLARLWAEPNVSFPWAELGGSRDDMREELDRGPGLLTRWVAAALTRTGSSLLLIMDGDQ